MIRNFLSKILVCALLFGVLNIAYANDIKVLPNEGTLATLATYYDFLDDRLLVGTELIITAYKDIISINANAITDTNRVFLGIGVSVNLEKVSKILGFEFKLVDPLRVGIFSSRDFLDGKWLVGIMVGARFTY